MYNYITVYLCVDKVQLEQVVTEQATVCIDIVNSNIGSWDYGFRLKHIIGGRYKALGKKGIVISPCTIIVILDTGYKKNVNFVTIKFGWYHVAGPCTTYYMY